MKCTTIKFSRYGQSLETRKLSSRFTGEAVRQVIISSFEETDKFVFDFTDIDSISTSFADECFAKLVTDFEFHIIKTKTTFKNTSPFIKTAVSTAFKHRLSTKRRELEHCY